MSDKWAHKDNSSFSQDYLKEEYKGERVDFTHANNLAKRIIEKMESQSVLSKVETSFLPEFDESKVIIPWYLKPFSKKIRAIASRHFIDGYCSNKKGWNDTITFKRPGLYKGKP